MKKYDIYDNVNKEKAIVLSEDTVVTVRNNYGIQISQKDGNNKNVTIWLEKEDVINLAQILKTL
jgi:hypothetical protein